MWIDHQVVGPTKRFDFAGNLFSYNPNALFCLRFLTYCHLLPLFPGFLLEKKVVLLKLNMCFSFINLFILSWSVFLLLSHFLRDGKKGCCLWLSKSFIFSEMGKDLPSIGAKPSHRDRRVNQQLPGAQAAGNQIGQPIEDICKNLVFNLLLYSQVVCSSQVFDRFLSKYSHS